MCHVIFFYTIKRISHGLITGRDRYLFGIDNSTFINTILSISLLKIVIVKRAEFPQILVESSYLCSIKSLEYHD